jgi:hypothetical protein
VFDDLTIDGFYDVLDKDDEVDYYKGITSIDYLKQVKDDRKEDSDEVYIEVHDSNKFFSLLDDIIDTYGDIDERGPISPVNYIRSIWLRMGVNDISNVEGFLQRELSFLKNYSILSQYKEIENIDEDSVLAYAVRPNEDWFETFQNIVFFIRDNSYFEEDFLCDYYLPGIHFGLSKVNNEPTCFIYGIQTICSIHNPSIKENLQLVRKSLRNKYVSADFLIGLSLFLDYLYDLGLTRIEVPTLQVFNYPYHEALSSSISSSYSGYSSEECTELEELYKNGDRSDKVLDYIHTKGMVDRFVDKEDLISYNKVDRFIDTFMVLMEKTNSFEIISEPLVNGENMVLKLTGKSNLLDDYKTKKRTK